MPASAPRALQTELRNCVENLTLKDLVTFLQEKGHALTDSVNAHVTKHPELGKMSILQILALPPMELELGRCMICMEATTPPFVCCPGPLQREELDYWRFCAFPDGKLDLHHPLPQGVHAWHSACAGIQMASDSRCPICRVELSESPPWEVRLNGADRFRQPACGPDSASSVTGPGI
jgi:hypothetical protein